MVSDIEFIELCGVLAAQAASNAEQPVGSIITRNNEIISKAGEASKSKNDITCHAEIEAIRLAVKELKTSDLSDCVLYSTHEPCIMCAYVIRYHKIKKVVYKNTVKFLGGVSSSMPLLITNEVPLHWSSAPVLIQVEGQ
jgi:tRNA(adenine34) deaminase